MKLKPQWNFSLIQQQIVALVKKIDLFSKKQRHIFFLGTSLVTATFLFCFSLQMFYKTCGLEKTVSDVVLVFEKRRLSLERKRRGEELSRKNPSAEFIQKLSKEVQAAQYKKELSLITQFQGFELLKGHESKVVFNDLLGSEWVFHKKEIAGLDGFKEVEYQLSEPIYLSDEELKTFLTLIENNNNDKPACFIKHIEIEKKTTPDGKDSYQTLLTVVVREKSISRI